MPRISLRSLLPARDPLALLIAVVMLLALAAAMLASLPARAAAATGTSTISGTFFQDTNRNGIQDAGEAPMANEGVELLDPTGQTLYSYTSTDANGHYAFSGLADGTYLVKMDPYDWSTIWHDWTPTTTGSLHPAITVTLSGSAVANFGWRQVVRSSTPFTSYTGPNGLSVASYDDVVAAKTVYDDLMSGSLVGPEASHISVLFDYSNAIDFTGMSVNGSAGSYNSYSASIQTDWISWLQGGDQTLFHEYGHAWSWYYAYMVQQDPTLTAYLKARGVYGDSRLDSTQAWNRNELIAEDYRQLFGTPNAQLKAQWNTDIPPAAAVPGLKSFLQTTFTQPPSSSSASTTSAPVDSTAPSVAGTAAVGSTLNCNDGTWSGSPTYAVSWQRDGTNIAGATAQSYVVASADAGHVLTCAVTATNSAGSTSARSSNSLLIPVPAAPSLSGLAMNPSPVRTSGTASVSLSAPANVTIWISDAKGNLVRTLLSSAAEQAGPVSVSWNRTNSSGTKVRTGTYTLSVSATDAYGHTVTANTTFATS